MTETSCGWLSGSTKWGHREHQVLGPVFIELHDGASVRTLAFNAHDDTAAEAIMHNSLSHTKAQLLGASGANGWCRPGPEGASLREVGPASDEPLIYFKTRST